MMGLTLEEVQYNLKIKLAKDTLTTAEVTEGIRECFANCQMVFMMERRPDMSEEQVSHFASELIQEVYQQQGLTIQTATPTMLRHIISILDSRFEFMQDPELREIHMGVIDMLLAKLEANA